MQRTRTHGGNANGDFCHFPFEVCLISTMQKGSNFNLFSSKAKRMTAVLSTAERTTCCGAQQHLSTLMAHLPRGDFVHNLFELTF